MLLWKGKGTNPAVSPEGEFIGYERGGGVVLESTIKKVELYRNPQGMDPQWWSEDEFAYRVGGQTYFYTYDVREDQVQRLHPAPGAVFLANNRHWASWEKKPGRLWVDGKIVKEGAPKPHYISPEGEVMLAHVFPQVEDRLEEMASAIKVDWVRTKGDFLVVALELPDKKLKIYVEEMKL